MIIGSAYIYILQYMIWLYNYWNTFKHFENPAALSTLLFRMLPDIWDLLKLADGTTQPSHPPRLYVATRNNHSVQNHHPILSDVIHWTIVSLFMFKKNTCHHPRMWQAIQPSDLSCFCLSQLTDQRQKQFPDQPPLQVLVFWWKLVISSHLPNTCLSFWWFGGACHLSTRFFHHLASMHKEIQEQILRTFERSAGKNGEGVQYQPMGQGFF